MTETNPVVQVTLLLPQKTYERVAQVALTTKKQPEDLLSSLVAEGLDAHSSISEILERISVAYRHRLAQKGKLNQSSETTIQELRNIREQIVDELYS